MHEEFDGGHLENDQIGWRSISVIWVSILIGPGVVFRQEVLDVVGRRQISSFGVFITAWKDHAGMP